MREKFKQAVISSKGALLNAKDIALRANDALPKTRANEIRLSTAGGVVGAIGGATLIGGMGLAALGTAIPVAGFAAVGLVGVALGNKVGSEIDRRKLAKTSKVDADQNGEDI